MNKYNKMIQLYLIFVRLAEILMLGLEKVLLEELVARREVMFVVKLKVLMMYKLD